jgi:hypothetical protein
MDDPVLHRKMFRHAALRSGALKPRSYQVGAPEFGVSTQVASRNPAYTAPTQVFEKGGVRYFVNAAGQIIGTERTNPLQIEYKPSMGTRIGNKFFDIAERFVSPEGYSKNIQSLKNIGSALTKGETYVKGAKTVGRGVKSLVNPALIAPALTVEKGLEEAGLGEASTLAYLGSEGARAAGKALTSKPGAVRSTIGYGLRAAGLPASVRALGTRAMMTPMGAGITAAAAVPYGMYKLDQYLRQPKKVYDPEKKIYVDVESDFAKQDRYMNSPEGREIFTPMSPDDMMNFQQQTALENQATPAAAASAMPGSDLATTGEIPSGTTDMGQGTGGTGTPPGGSVVPVGGAGDNSGVKDNTGVSTNIAGGIEDKKNEVINKKNTPKVKKESELGFLDKLSNFARTDAGNMFMLKLAAGLLTGKGNFGEVLGAALNPAVDVLAAYKLKEQEFANELYKQTLKTTSDRAEDSGTIPIPDGTGGMIYIDAFRDAKKPTEVYYYDNTGRKTYVDPSQTGLFTQRDKVIGTKQLEILAKVGDNLAGSAIVNGLLRQDDATLGTSGYIKYFGNRIAGVAGALTDVPKNVNFDKVYDEEGRELKGSDKIEVIDEKGNKSITTLDNALKRYDKNSQVLFNKLKADPKTAEILAANGVKAETLKYFLANAFKTEDRLTNRDLEFIGKITNILAFSKGGDMIKAELREISGYLDKKRDTFTNQLRGSGYSDLFLATNVYGSSGGKVGLGWLTQGLEDQQRKSITEGKKIPDINTLLQNQGIK